jgi:hypothetical protein
MVEAWIVPAGWGFVPSVFCEEPIEPICDREAPDGKRINKDAMSRMFVLRAGVATHQ